MSIITVLTLDMQKPLPKSTVVLQEKKETAEKVRAMNLFNQHAPAYENVDIIYYKGTKWVSETSIPMTEFQAKLVELTGCKNIGHQDYEWIGRTTLMYDTEMHVCIRTGFDYDMDSCETWIYAVISSDPRIVEDVKKKKTKNYF
jgi:hypothetical protein